MNPQNPTPTPADDQQVTDVAKRVGPPIVLAALVATAALLAWLALAPTAIDGPLEEAPFTVPATLVTPPDDDGCLRLVDGDGASRELCVDELARGDEDDEWRHTDAWFDVEGRLVGMVEDGTDRRLLHVDAETAAVIGTLPDAEFDDPGMAPRPAPEEAPVEAPVDEPPAPDAETFVYTDGDRVLRSDDGRWEPATDEVVLDLQAPPGYRLDQAVVSPDDRWVVVLTGGGEVAVAPTDGSAAPHVWVELPRGRWLDLHRAIRWDG